ncbi:hypothetical protein EZS27_014140 [termite gut metagenome]|uniref:DNA-binding protein n=1 Tax=termite gut metagenome TaxID=433724 RepID=A0A5J4RX84_9ZZZZ
MEDFRKKSGNNDTNDKEIMFTQSIKAGKRIYYLDVKKSRRDEMFLAITESKKIIQGEGEDAQISFEKHKIFLYREDFEKFMAGLEQAIAYIEEKQEIPRKEYYEKGEEEIPVATTEESGTEDEKTTSPGIKIDIDFE